MWTIGSSKLISGSALTQSWALTRENMVHVLPHTLDTVYITILPTTSGNEYIYLWFASMSVLCRCGGMEFYEKNSITDEPQVRILYISTSRPTPQVASLAVHMSARANKEIKKNKKKEKNNQKKKKKRTSSGIRTRVLWLTDSESMGARSHRTDCTYTYMYFLMEGQKRWWPFQRLLCSCGRRRMSWVTAVHSSSTLGTRHV